MKTTKTIYLALLAVLLSPMAANASLIGTTVDCSFDGAFSEPFCNGSGLVESGGLAEFQIGYTQFTFPSWEIDIDDSTIDITQVYPNSATNVGGILMLSNLIWQGTPGVITGTSVSITNGNVTDFTDGDVIGLPDGLPANSLAIDLGGFWSIGSSARITLTVEHTVPEPGTLALLGLGLVGMAARRRKKV